VLYPPELRGRNGFLTGVGVLLSSAPLFVTINDELGSIESADLGIENNGAIMKFSQPRPNLAMRHNAALRRYTLVLIVLAMYACGASGPRPLSITMFHPEKKNTIECKARDLGLADPNMLADSVEACARP
jgi:hypothetical protein